MTTLLITTANRPPEGVPLTLLKNNNLRQITSKAAVYQFIALGIKQLIIADSTASELFSQEEILNIKKLIDIEQIYFQQENTEIQNKGKGFGEGKILKYAIENSSILKNQNYFYKCTGKVFVRNFNEINEYLNINNINNIFWKEPLTEYLDTRFFKTSKNYLIEKIIPAYEEVNDRANYFTEISLFNKVSRTLEKKLTIRPMISGFSGSFNKPYFDESLGYLDRNFPSFVGS